MRLEIELLGDDAIFVALGGRQLLIRRAEHRRRIRHRRIQPALVELVSQIVVVGDVAFRAASRVVVPRVPEAAHQGEQLAAARDMGQRRVVGASEFQQRRQVRRFPIPFHVGFGKADRAAQQQPPHRARMTDDQRRVRAGLGAGGVEDTAVGHGDRKLAVLQALRHVDQHAQRAGQSGGRGGEIVHRAMRLSAGRRIALRAHASRTGSAQARSSPKALFTS